jgi:hypothetical protein
VTHVYSKFVCHLPLLRMCINTDLLGVEVPCTVVWTHHFMHNTALHLHGWLEIKWHHFQLASVLFRFELQQVTLAVSYMELPVPSVVTGV